MTPVEMTRIMDIIHERAHELLEFALQEGVVLTIETKPTEPLAMGKYNMVVETRLARWRHATLDK